MIRFPYPSVPALAIATLFGAAVPAQTRSHYAACGDANSVNVLNVARATTTGGSSPYFIEELSSQGRFLGYYGSFYRGYVQGVGSSQSRGGLGNYTLQVAGDTVSSRWASTATAQVGESLRRPLSSSQQYLAGFFPVTLSGTIFIDYNVGGSFGFPASGVSYRGRLHSNAWGSASATLGLTLSGWSTRTYHPLQFGGQRFDGTTEVWSWGDNSDLRFEMTAMVVSLTTDVYAGSTLVLRIVFCNDRRNPVVISSFL